MADLSTKYLGLRLKNPVVVAACSLSGHLDTIKQCEDAGAGALVIKSLFEEQILHDMGKFEEALDTGSGAFAEALSYFPALKHGGAREHLSWVEKVRAAVKMPLIGSLNAVHPFSWVDYARQMADTGVDALELNVYAVEADTSRRAEAVEARVIETFEAVRAATKLPIAVKLSPFYTCVGNVVAQLESCGAEGVILFNRFLQPDIDPDAEDLVSRMTPSSRADMRVPLRWIALLFGRLHLDLIGNSGVTDGRDVARYLLAGAAAVQAASAFYRDGLSQITKLVAGLEEWMSGKGYARLEDFRGKVSQARFKGDPSAFERAQYMDLLMSRK